MINFYEHLPIETTTEMEQMSRLMFELRENRNLLLRQYDVSTEPALLEKIISGEVPEHPAYEHYLGAQTLAKTRELVSTELKQLLKELGA